MFAKLVRQLTGLILLSGVLLWAIQFTLSARGYGSYAHGGSDAPLLVTDYLAVIAWCSWCSTLFVNGLLFLANRPGYLRIEIGGIIAYLLFVMFSIGGVPHFDSVSWRYLTGIWLFWVVPSVQFLHLCVSSVDAGHMRPAKAQ